MSKPLPKIFLKKGKETFLKNRHPWIYSGAVASTESAIEAGSVVTLCTPEGNPIGIGFYNEHSSIRIRMLSFADTSWTLDSLYRALDKAWERRLGLNRQAYRVVHAEADHLPGLIVDWYNGTVVFQASTAGMQQLKTEITAHIMTRWKAKACIENVDAYFLQQEGFNDVPPLFLGDITEQVTFEEHGVSYTVNVLDSQKTGFYLDQSDNRLRLKTWVKPGDNILNGCAFTGAFSVIAGAQGATTTSVDISKKALHMAKQNFVTNGLSPEQHRFISADIFDFLATDTEIYDLVIIDPPAFAKKSEHLPQARKAYTQLHSLALQRVKPGGHILTCSCSHALDWESYTGVIRHASSQSKRDVYIAGRYTQPLDHPLLATHPESEYLRTFLLQV